MTKKEWIELIQHDMAGGDLSDEQLSKWHPEIVSRHTEIVFNTILGEIIKTTRGNRDFSVLDPYAMPFFDVDILEDTNRADYYFKLPQAVVRLENNNGIRLICPMKDINFPFVNRDSGSNFAYNELEVSTVSKFPVYYLENDTVRLPDYDRWKDIDCLLVKLIVPFSRLEDDDEVPVPEGRDDYFMDKIAKRLMTKHVIPVDDQNDQNSKTS